MTISIPFIFFSFLFIHHYMKMGKRLDIAGLILLLFGISALFSIIMYVVDIHIEASDTYIPSYGATLFYCGFLFICLFPFLKFSNLSYTEISPSKHPRSFKVLAWLAFFWFLMTFFIDINAIIQVLSGDMATLRAAIYEGEGRLIQSEASKIPFLVRAPWTLFNYIFKCSWVMIFFAFYAKSIQKLPWVYFIFFLLASTNAILDSILGLDRSKVAYWIIGIGANYMFFNKNMGQREKKVVKMSIFVLVSLAVVYLSLMTESRFEDRTFGTSAVGGSLGSIITYFGQPFPNFCFFFDNFDCKWTTLACLFPTFYYFFFPDEPSGLVLVQQTLDAYIAYRTGVFYTFMGTIMIMAGKSIMIIFCLFYSLISYIVLRSNSKKRTTIATIYVYYALSSVLTLGLFAYYYGNPLLDLSVITSFIIIKNFFQQGFKVNNDTKAFV